ncbi:C40 family peptidase [Dactylosporangium aurantiacum]|uniref:C40 family peptidase n=1 Tax=Dactylosporangium aurantiacum TaxID=35754 RepID=A0A9Q9MFV0_9ACTN|nr:NlpC/P60 family protein [Dactylosporangium aurantiacum]MDG6101099.1 NlpC/P60 family protein [Dactylosporangium aurantiacum]UWZ54864.1 C40 family peptidase [Dactylosporangium aurantiacum]
MFVAAVVCTLLCSLVPRPAYADPGGVIPDTGSRPIASGTLVMPGQGGTTAPPAAGGSSATLRGPLATRLATLEIAVNTLGQKRLQAQLNLETAQAAATDAQDKLRAATAQVAELRSRADSAAAEAYKRATGLGPLDGYAHDLHQFGLLAPGIGQQPGSQQDARDLLRAEQEETAAKQQYQLAQTAYLSAQSAYAPIDAQFQAQNAEYVQLKTQNEQAVLQIAAQEDAAEQSRGTVSTVPVDGMVANPKAIQALNYALSKIGSWYVWGDEGPSTFDCSGLAYWSYGQVGVRVPRVANDMYHGTPAIRATKNSLGDLLLPGDLVFFASDSGDWRSIYHMGIYVGGGKMVHAPTTGEKVKIGQVKWSRFFGATRIFPAVQAPGATPSATSASPSSTGTASPSSSTSSTASPSASTTTSPSGSASPTVTNSPSESHSPSPTSTTTSAPPPQPEPSDEQTSQAPSTPAKTTAASPSKSSVEPTSTGASTAAQTTASAAGN